MRSSTPFTETLRRWPRLAACDTAVAIQTYDPNLNESFLAACRPANCAEARVIKPGRYEDESVQEVSDCGAIALNSPYDTERPVEAAFRLSRFRRRFYRVQVLISLLLTLAGVALGGWSHALPAWILTAAPLLFQALVTAIGAIVSYARLRGEKPQEATSTQ